MKGAIKIKTVSQWYLLMQINNYLGKRKVPKAVLRKIYYMLYSQELGKDGFIVLSLKNIKDNITGLEEIVDLYPYICNWEDKIDDIDTGKRKQKRCWYISYANIKRQKTRIALIYATKTN